MTFRMVTNRVNLEASVSLGESFKNRDFGVFFDFDVLVLSRLWSGCRDG